MGVFLTGGKNTSAAEAALKINYFFIVANESGQWKPRPRAAAQPLIHYEVSRIAAAASESDKPFEDIYSLVGAA